MLMLDLTERHHLTKIRKVHAWNYKVIINKIQIFSFVIRQKKKNPTNALEKKQIHSTNNHTLIDNQIKNIQSSLET